MLPPPQTEHEIDVLTHSVASTEPIQHQLPHSDKCDTIYSVEYSAPAVHNENATVHRRQADFHQQSTDHQSPINQKVQHFAKPDLQKLQMYSVDQKQTEEQANKSHVHSKSDDSTHFTHTTTHIPIIDQTTAVDHHQQQQRLHTASSIQHSSCDEQSSNIAIQEHLDTEMKDNSELRYSDHDTGIDESSEHISEEVCTLMPYSLIYFHTKPLSHLKCMYLYFACSMRLFLCVIFVFKANKRRIRPMMYCIIRATGF